MGLSRQECWSGLPCPPPGDLPNPGVKPRLSRLLHWQLGSLPLVPPALSGHPHLPGATGTGTSYHSLQGRSANTQALGCHRVQERGGKVSLERSESLSVGEIGRARWGCGSILPRRMRGRAFTRGGKTRKQVGTRRKNVPEVFIYVSIC